MGLILKLWVLELNVSFFVIWVSFLVQLIFVVIFSTMGIMESHFGYTKVSFLVPWNLFESMGLIFLCYGVIFL